VKFKKRGSVISSEAAAAAPLGTFCFGIVAGCVDVDVEVSRWKPRSSFYSAGRWGFSAELVSTCLPDPAPFCEASMLLTPHCAEGQSMDYHLQLIIKAVCMCCIE